MSKNIVKSTIILLLSTIIIFNIILFPTLSYAASTYTQRLKSGIDEFPKQYQTYLEKLKESHPNWTFDAYYTGISWDELIANETDHGHNRVIRTADDSWKCSCGNVASGYACASKGIISYYLDPRNFLDDVSVFQFLEISYNSNVHQLSGVETAVKNTFLDNRVTFNLDGNERNMSYAEIILDAAKESGMSPYSIRTKIIQEVGTQGSRSVTGNYPGYEGYYNFYNYGAYDAGNAIANALEYAKNAGWDNQYTAIVEGAKLLANSYTNAGQNTAYFYKWDVVGNSILKSGNEQTFNNKSYFFRHQYMTNVQDPKSQSKTLFNLYASIGIIDENLNFIIPIYDNMPSRPVGLPSTIAQDDDTLVYYVTDSDGINVRSEPTTSGNTRICSIPKDTKIIVLEKDVANANGYTWYKIQLENGTVGYVVKNYIAYYSGKEIESNTENNSEPNNNNNNNEQNNNQNKETKPNTDTTKYFKLDSKNLIATIIPDATVKNITSDKKYTIKNTENKVLSENDVIKNEYKLIDNNKNIEYKIVKLGDSNGDGKVNSADLLSIQKHLLNVRKIDNKIRLLAADANNDGKVNSADLLKIQKHLLNITKISL